MPTPAERDGVASDHRFTSHLAEVLFAEEVAALFRISTSQARQNLAAGVYGPRFRLGKRYGILRSELRLHDIRHTVGAILATNGVSLEIIAKVLGHKSLETTRRYSHLMPSVLSHAAKVLAAAIPTDRADRVSEPRSTWGCA